MQLLQLYLLLCCCEYALLWEVTLSMEDCSLSACRAVL